MPFFFFFFTINNQTLYNVYIYNIIYHWVNAVLLVMHCYNFLKRKGYIHVTVRQCSIFAAENGAQTPCFFCVFFCFFPFLSFTYFTTKKNNNLDGRRRIRYLWRLQFWSSKQDGALFKIIITTLTISYRLVGRHLGWNCKWLLFKRTKASTT
jgi:hypothetical protein